jgi:glutaredoxin/glutathione-dependent peroxiredoxin
MPIVIGDPLPDIPVQVLGNNGPEWVSVAKLGRQRHLVLFAVPGAFTPACSARHLPGFMERAAAFKARGVDLIACIAVNDAFVMAAWAERNAVGNRVTMLADGNCAFTRAIGLVEDLTPYGMGFRSRRYALIARDGNVTHLSIEEPGAYAVSAASHVLAHL